MLAVKFKIKRICILTLNEEDGIELKLSDERLQPQNTVPEVLARVKPSVVVLVGAAEQINVQATQITFEKILLHISVSG